MSDASDDLDNYLARLDTYQEINDDYIDRRIWVTKQGVEIKIEKMELSHLKNTIAMVNRNNPNSRYLPILNNELNKRLSKKNK